MMCALDEVHDEVSDQGRKFRSWDRPHGWVALALLVLAAGTGTVEAATVTGYVRDRRGDPVATNLAFRALQRPLLWHTNILGGWNVETNSATDGFFAVSLMAGDFAVRIGTQPQDQFIIAVPDSTNSHPIHELATNLAGLTYAGGLSGVFQGATAGTAGKKGLVPAPAAGQHTDFLRGDGTWAAMSTDFVPSLAGAATNLAVHATDFEHTPLRVFGAVDQLEELQTWHDSNETKLAWVDANGVFGGNAGGLTNLPVHLDGLGTFSTNIVATPHTDYWLNHPAGPFRFVCLGDSMADRKYAWIEGVLRNVFGINGGAYVNSSSGGFQCWVTTNGAVTLRQRNTNWFLNHYEIDDTGSITLSQHAALGVDQTNILADTFAVYYLVEPGAGDFKVQTSSNYQAWVDQLTVAADGAYGGRVTNFTLPTARYTMRIYGTGPGPVKILGGGLWHSQSNGLWTSIIAEGGLGVSNILEVSTNVTWPILAAVSPKLLIWEMDQEPSLASNLWHFEHWFTNTCPKMDVVYSGQVPRATNDIEIVAHNAAVKQHAAAHHRFYFDAYTPFRSHAWATNLGWYDDHLHPSRTGSVYLASILLRELGLVNHINLNAACVDARWGGNLNLFNNGKTNLLGIGTANPRARVTLKGGLDGYVYLDAVSGGHGTIWLGHSGRALNWAQFALSGNDGGTTFLNAPSDKISFSIGGTTRAHVSPTGGFSVGNWPNDPGAGNLHVAGGADLGDLAVRGNNATANHVWTCTNATTGAGHWAAAPGAGGGSSLPAAPAWLGWTNAASWPSHGLVTTNAGGSNVWRRMLPLWLERNWGLARCRAPVSTGIDSLGMWVVASGTTAARDAESGSLAYLNIASGASAGDVGKLYMNGYRPIYMNRGWHLACAAGFDETNAVRCWVGGFNGSSSVIEGNDNPANAHVIAFRYSTSAADDGWQACARDGTTLNVIGTGVAPVRTNTHWFEVIYDAQNASALFRLNGVNVATNHVNLPPATQSLQPIVSVTTLEDAAKAVRWSWSYYEINNP